MSKWKPLFCKLILLGLVASSVACKPAIKTRQELATYINDPENGLLKFHDVGNMKSSIMFKPRQLMLASPVNKKEKRLPVEKKFYHFVFSISADKKEVLRQLPFSKYSEMVQVFAFRMPEFIRAIADHGKPIDPAGCFYLPTYGVADANELLIVFDEQSFKQAENVQIVIKEFGLDTGDLTFIFKTSDINRISDIHIN